MDIHKYDRGEIVKGTKIIYKAAIYKNLRVTSKGIYRRRKKSSARVEFK